MAEHKRVTMQLRGLDQDGGDVRFDDFITQLDYFKKALSETQSLISEKNHVYFKIVDLRHNSPAQIVVEAVPIQPAYEITAEKIIDEFFCGMEQIQGGKIPEGFSYQTLESYRNLTHLKDIHRLEEISLSKNGESIKNLEELSKNISIILGNDEVEIGSFTGMLESINIHGEAKYFNLYQTSFPSPKLKCIFPKQLRSDAIAALGEHVRVTGEKKFKPKLKDPFPFEMLVNQIEVLPDEDQLPRLRDLKGIAPNATGAQSSEDFVRKVRNGWK